jgi:hypothetical protein
MDNPRSETSDPGNEAEVRNHRFPRLKFKRAPLPLGKGGAARVGSPRLARDRRPGIAFEAALPRAKGWALSILLHGGVLALAALSAVGVQRAVESSGGSGGGVERWASSASYSAALPGSEERLQVDARLPDLPRYGPSTFPGSSSDPILEESPLTGVSFEARTVDPPEPSRFTAAKRFLAARVWGSSGVDGRSKKLPLVEKEGEESGYGSRVPRAPGGSGDDPPDRRTLNNGPSVLRQGPLPAPDQAGGLRPGSPMRGLQPGLAAISAPSKGGLEFLARGLRTSPKGTHAPLPGRVWPPSTPGSRLGTGILAGVVRNRPLGLNGRPGPANLMRPVGPWAKGRATLYGPSMRTSPFLPAGPFGVRPVGVAQRGAVKGQGAALLQVRAASLEGTRARPNPATINGTGIRTFNPSINGTVINGTGISGTRIHASAGSINGTDIRLRH